LSPRAACRLETLGFREVYDYRPGKADWFAAGLPREGSKANVERAGDAVEMVPTCKLSERVGDVAERTEKDVWAVTTPAGCLLGIVKLDEVTDPDASVEDVMLPGPSTWRPNVSARELREYLTKKGRSEVFITTSDGTLMGAFKV
jgi:hypothetical protein